MDNDLNTDATTMQPNTAVAVHRQSGDLLEHALTREIQHCNSTSRPLRVTHYVFVECFNDNSSLKEAIWALSMVQDPSSLVSAVVAHVPVPEGGEAVKAFMQSLPAELLPGLRGARVSLLGNPMPAPDACLTTDYETGLQMLEEFGLCWEICCHFSALVHVATHCANRPHLTFVLDHLGRNGGDESDIQEWKSAIAALAKHPNVYAKVGGIEEWGVKDPNPLLDWAVVCFGFQRLMFESNWFVSKSVGFTYDRLVKTTETALRRNHATEGDVQDVFGRNAERVYRLTPAL